MPSDDDVPQDEDAADPVEVRRAAKVTKTLTEQTVSGLSWQFLGTGAELVVRITVMVVLARLLEPAEFGVAAAATVVISFSQIFAQLGVGQAIIQRPNLSDDHMRAGFAFSVWSGAVIALIIFCAAPLIAAGFKMPSLQWPVALLSVVFLLTGPAIVPAALMQRDRQYKRVAAIETLTFTLAYLVVAVALAYLGWGLWSLVVAQLVQTSLKSVSFMTLKPAPKALLIKWSALRAILGTGAGYSLGSIGNFVATNGDNVAVGRFLGAEALGVYGRAYQFLMVPTNLFGAVVDKVLFPAMAHVQTDRERLSRAFQRSLAAVALITLPVSGVLYVLAPELVYIALGPKWDSVVVPFQVLALTLLFRTSYKMSDSLARATGSVYQRAWRQWIYAGAVLVGASVGAVGGVGGVSIGVGLAITLNFFLMLQLSLVITGVRWSAVAAIHARSAIGAAPVIGLSTLVIYLCRNHEIGPFVTASLGAATAGLVLMIAVSFGRRIYGSDGAWIIDLGRKLIFRRFASSLER